jgi:hypothetical protein
MLGTAPESLSGFDFKVKEKKNATGFKEPGGSTIGNFDSFLR